MLNQSVEILIPTYGISAGFIKLNHMGATLTRVGVRQEHFDGVVVSLGRLGLSPINAIRKRVLGVGQVYNWIDFEVVDLQSQHHIRQITDYVKVGLSDLDNEKPYIIDSILFDERGAIIGRCHTSEPSLDYEYITQPYYFLGIQGEVIRNFNIYTSKEVPIVDQITTLDMVEPRTAALIYLAPYTKGNNSQLVMANSGAELVALLQKDVVELELVNSGIIKLLRSYDPDYRIALLTTLSKYKDRYGKITPNILTSIVVDHESFTED